MKKLLLATTILVAGASIAAAEVTLSGSARMGVISGFDDGNALDGDESDLAFTSRARVQFDLMGETDGGLSFGASFRADNAADANQGDAGSVYMSGAFGKLSMGDVDGAAQMATGHVAGVGLTGLGDLNESTFLGAGGGVTDPTALYEYAAGDFTVYLSATNPVPLIDDNVAPVADTVLSDLTALAVGAKYSMGDYAIGLGYERLRGLVSTGAFEVGVPATTADNVDVDHVVLKLSGQMQGFEMQGLIGQADGTLVSLATATSASATTTLDHAMQYAASLSYTTAELTGTVFYTDDEELGGVIAYGIGASYDLGGGAQVVGGLVKNHSDDTESYDLGVSFSF